MARFSPFIESIRQEIAKRLWFVAHADSPISPGRGIPGCRQSGSEILEQGKEQRTDRSGVFDCPSRPSPTGLVGHAGDQGLEGRQSQRGNDGEKCEAAERDGKDAGSMADAGVSRRRGKSGKQSRGRPVIANDGENFWSSCTWLPCRDGKWRPTKSGIFPLSHGVPGRVDRLKAIGNAIVPQVAAEFIKAYLEVIDA